VKGRFSGGKRTNMKEFMSIYLVDFLGEVVGKLTWRIRKTRNGSIVIFCIRPKRLGY
jgi:hypothetical protein